MSSAGQPQRLAQSLVGASVLLLGLGLAVGAWDIPSAAGYGGAGPNFLPWVVASALAVCGVLLLVQARTGGFKAMPEDDSDGADSSLQSPCWSGFFWVSAGLLANAALITTLGFILSCALCFALAVRGLRQSVAPEGLQAKPAKPHALLRLLKDALLGIAIAAPVYWMFTKLLAINLPGLTATGWI